MTRCSYDLYVEAFRAVRAAVDSGDAEALRSLRHHAARAHGVNGLVWTLAQIEAQHGAIERTKADVCGGVLCPKGCPDALTPPPPTLPMLDRGGPRS